MERIADCGHPRVDEEGAWARWLRCAPAPVIGLAIAALFASSVALVDRLLQGEWDPGGAAVRFVTMSLVYTGIVAWAAVAPRGRGWRPPTGPSGPGPCRTTPPRPTCGPACST